MMNNRYARWMGIYINNDKWLRYEYDYCSNDWPITKGIVDNRRDISVMAQYCMTILNFIQTLTSMDWITNLFLWCYSQ